MYRPDIPLSFSMRGYVRLRVFDAKTHKLTDDSGWFENLITDQGLDAIAQQTDVMTHYHVGTSSTEPQETDTWVGAHVATSSTVIFSTSGVSGVDPHYGFRRQTIRYPVGAATGNLSEMAVGWSATTGTAFSHELIRDPNDGDEPTTITVLADEYLEFTYELRYYPATSDATGTISISGVSYNYTVRALAVTNTFWWADSVGKLFTFQAGDESYHRAYTGGLSAMTASVPLGNTASGTTSVTTLAYVPGNYFRDFTVSANDSQWNVPGGVAKSFTLGCKGCRWQAEIGKVSDGTGHAKSGANTLSLNWRVSWARAAA